MADTARTATDLLTNLFQDGQVANSITAQDLRDLIVSVRPAHGDFSINASAATTITVAGTYYKAAGTTTLHGTGQDVTMPANNRLTYTGTPARYGVVSATVSAVCGTNNQVLAFKIAKNGVVVDETIVQQWIATATDQQAVSILWHGSMATNDYFEIWCTNETSTATVTCDQMHMHLMGHIDGT
jgi:hypothetical protein